MLTFGRGYQTFCAGALRVEDVVKLPTNNVYIMRV